MLEANYLTILLKPNYEKPVDSAHDVLDRGLKIIYEQGTESVQSMLLNSPSNITRKLAEATVVPEVIVS